jgi:hypothetical protein
MIKDLRLKQREGERERVGKKTAHCMFFFFFLYVGRFY